ncbi:tRNA 4-thiouridine(8) synthase ThiI [bacterium]|nr:tRNA 4-thiouridine(8) synthase ThiI [candidate division CSSED10-310 bacterium]
MPHPDAVLLYSGGLDSMLTLLLLQRQSLQVTALHLVHDLHPKRHAAMARIESDLAKWRVPLEVRDVNREMLEMIHAPRFGFGKRMNPCIDCHIMMLGKAHEAMVELGASFLVTGEVVGQRPMSQKSRTMALIERRAGVEGMVLRPLSAWLLAPTWMERNGLVDRNRLMGINGRGRKEQIRLAAEFGLTDLPTPAGGCLLTDKGFSRRLGMYIEDHGTIESSRLHMLHVGRHFRLADGTRLVVGRTELENQRLREMAQPWDVHLMHLEVPGAEGLILRPAPGAAIDPGVPILAAAILARYSKAAPDQAVLIQVSCRQPAELGSLRAKPVDAALLAEYHITGS